MALPDLEEMLKMNVSVFFSYYIFFIINYKTIFR